MFISDQFEVIELLGKGGFGSVYKAKQVLQDRYVAIKVLNDSFRDDESKLRKFQREAKTTSALDHPHIVKVFAFGLDSDDHPYFAMEYLEGKTLAELLRDNGKLSELEFAEIFAQVCSALEYAHERGVVHRDLKPENIMVTTTATGERDVKLLDFGIASQPEGASGHTTTLVDPGKLIGSPQFMSPEQCQGQKPDARSDIYSLGCIMYQSIAGSPPFTGDSAHEIILKQLHEPPLSLTKSQLKIAPAMEKLVLRCLDKNPASRIQSVTDISNQLPAAIQAQSAKGGAGTSWNLSKTGIAISIVLALTVLAVAGFGIAQKNKAVSPTKKEQAKPPFSAMNEGMNQADAFDSGGQNDAAIAAYSQVIKQADRYQYPDESPTGKKLARVKYKCYRGIINARRFSVQSVGPDAIKDWENCYNASIKAFEHGSKNIAEAESRTAFAYTVVGPTPENLKRIQSFCEKAMKTLEIEMAASSSAKLFNMQADSLTKTAYADANIVYGHLRALRGEAKAGAEIIAEFLDFRGSKVDDRALFERVWLCQALNRAKEKEMEIQAIQALFQELNSNRKVHHEVRLMVLDKFFGYYIDEKLPSQCIKSADIGIEILRSTDADADQISRCLYYKSRAAALLKHTSDEAKWLKQSEEESAKSTYRAKHKRK